MPFISFDSCRQCSYDCHKWNEDNHSVIASLVLPFKRKSLFFDDAASMENLTIVSINSDDNKTFEDETSVYYEIQSLNDVVIEPIPNEQRIKNTKISISQRLWRLWSKKPKKSDDKLSVYDKQELRKRRDDLYVSIHTNVTNDNDVFETCHSFETVAPVVAQVTPCNNEKVGSICLSDSSLISLTHDQSKIVGNFTQQKAETVCDEDSLSPLSFDPVETENISSFIVSKKRKQPSYYSTVSDSISGFHFDIKENEKTVKAANKRKKFTTIKLSPWRRMSDDINRNFQRSNTSHVARNLFSELKVKKFSDILSSDRTMDTRSLSSDSSFCTVISDPCARPSKRMRRSNSVVRGDNDVWVEKILVNKRTGNSKSFFYSLKTGIRKSEEPPTGASKVIYCNDVDLFRQRPVKSTEYSDSDVQKDLDEWTEKSLSPLCESTTFEV